MQIFHIPFISITQHITSATSLAHYLPPTLVIFIQHRSSSCLPCFAVLHSAWTPICSLPLLFFHSHSAALSLIHKQYHSLQRQKVGRKGEEERVAPTDLLTAACWGLPETSQSEGWKEGRVRTRERAEKGGWGVRIRPPPTTLYSISSVPLSFSHHYSHSFTQTTIHLHDTSHLLHFHTSRWDQRKGTAYKTTSTAFVCWAATFIPALPNCWQTDLSKNNTEPHFYTIVAH